MVAHSVSHEFNEIWFFFLQDILACSSGRFPACQSIITVNSGTGNTHWNCPWDDTIWSVLVFSRSWNGVFVVSAKEESLAFESGSKVESYSEISFTGSTFSNVAGSDLLLIIDSESISWTCSLWDLSCLYKKEFLLKGDDTVTLLSSFEP